MKKIAHILSVKVVVCAFLYFITPVYGDIPWLHVDGNKIKDPNDNVVVLRGVSLIDLGFLEVWQGGAINMIDRLTDKTDTQGNSPGWYPKVLRIPIHPPSSVDDWPSRWYPNDDSFYNYLLRPIVDYCAQKDLYVILDWHYCADTWDKVEQTSEFWRYMAPRFANDSHVLFELFNEPINYVGSDTANWLSVRTDMQTWVDIVRSYAPYNLILVGGPIWAQGIGPAASYPVAGCNIAMVAHIYPAHWLGAWGDKQWHRNQLTTCAAVHPVIMTEWGFTTTSETLLNGTISNYGRPLMDFIEGLQIGNTAWVASYDWGPPMFYNDWTLRCGEQEMGCFVKDTLYAKRNDDQPHGAIQTPIDLVTPSTEDFETNDFNRFAWRRSGDASWGTTRQESHSGDYCAESGPIDDDESTSLQVTLDCVSGDITFYCKVSSESGYDYLKFSIDGVEKDEWSGEQDWRQISFPVDEGRRTFEWTYSKDSSASEGDDAVWIDDIVFPAVGEMEPPEAPFTRGVNLSGWFQYVSRVQQIHFSRYTKQDFIDIKSLGCDVIRLPIDLHAMTSGTPDYAFDPLFYYFLDQVVDWAEELELHLILENGSFDPAVTDIGNILILVWTQMAQRYKNRSTYIYYEVLNEPYDISDAKWNEIQQDVIHAIRAVDQKHTIIVGPAGYNSYYNLGFMPRYEDDNLIYTFHFYDPFMFTHQGASWIDPSMEPLAGVPFPYDAVRMPECPPELKGTWIEGSLNSYETEGTVQHVKELIDIAVRFRDQRRVPVFCGELGVLMLNSKDEDRVYWYSHVRNYLELKGIAWTMWDYKGGFGLFEQGSSERFGYDLNIPLVRALGFTAPPQRPFVPTPESGGFDLYLDNIAPDIIESSWISNGLLDFYCQDNPASGAYCIHWTGADLYNMISFRFSPVKDLSILVDEGFALDLWVRCNDPSAKIDVGFVDTKTNERGDHPWHIRYTLDRTVADWNGQWNHLQIPLNAFFEIGSYDDGWFNPRGAYDWTVTEHFEIVAEFHDLAGTHVYFDDICVVGSNPPMDFKKAGDPYPPDGAQFVSPNVTLNWAAAFSAASHHIYFGDNFSDVNAADISDTTGIYRGTQAATTYTPGPLRLDSLYYWRVDEVTTGRASKTHKGDVWSFTTAPQIGITDPNLLCWWTFDETEGTTAIDYSGHNHHGTVNGATWVASGRIGGALDFGGDGDHVLDEDAGNYLNGLDALTVCMWIKSNVTDTDKGFIICKEPDLGDNVITMRYDSAGLYGGGTRVMKMALLSTGGQQQLESSNNLQTTEWQHVTMTWSSGQALKFYVNGVLDSPMFNDTGAVGTLSGNMKLIIGKGGKDVGSSAGWDGMIDDVQIYNVALSDAEIYRLGVLP